MDLLVNLLFVLFTGARFFFFCLIVRGNRAIDKLMDWSILDEGMGYLLAAPDVLRVGGPFCPGARRLEHIEIDVLVP